MFFDFTLNRTIRDVHSLQAETTETMHRMESGDPSDLQKFLTAVEKARISFDLLMRMGQRAMGTYQEIMRNAHFN